jgi:CRISPR-associated endonuclease/helicase Cas3
MTPDAFPDFFKALHHQPPFPWQAELARRVAVEGLWPDLNLPTASGKTAVIDVAIFTLALEADRPEGRPRRAAMRTFFVVDRRIVVDEAARRAKRIAARLRTALTTPGDSPVLRDVARRLVQISGFDPEGMGQDRPDPLHVTVLRGGMYRDDTWAESPAQPTVCLTTVDQIGARLLFRGYGLGRSGRLIHAGLVGSDSLILVDEAHLSQPFLETLRAVQSYREEGRPAWGERMPALPFQVVQMSATPGRSRVTLALGAKDRANAVLGRRLQARKRAELVEVATGREEELNRTLFARRLADGALELARGDTPRADGKHPAHGAPVVGIVVNRVDTARRVFALLEKEGAGDVILLTGRIRPIDRDRLLYRWFDRMRAGRARGQSSERPLFVCATQTIEVGADLDLDALVTEAAPLDALRQRFGRLDRLGELGISRALVVARKDAVAAHADDPVYGRATAATWAWLQVLAGPPKEKQKARIVDFGVDALGPHLPSDPGALAPLNSPRAAAPVLLPAHIDTWVQTDPIPEPDPDVALFLHGPGREADVQVVWRADLPDEELIKLNERASVVSPRQLGDLADRCAAITALVPPSSLEALPVPLHAARAWLAEAGQAVVTDVEGPREPAKEVGDRRPGRYALQWRGPEDSALIQAEQLRPGDTIVVPSRYGGADQYGWDPASPEPVEDVGDHAALYGRGRATLRLHPNVIASWSRTVLAIDGRTLPEVIAALSSTPAHEEEDEDRFSPPRPDVDAILDRIRPWPGIPGWVQEACAALGRDRRLLTYPGRAELVRFVLIATRRVRPESPAWEGEASEPEGTADDDATSFATGGVPLDEHCIGVATRATSFARALGLPDPLVRDLSRAGRLHDGGKSDPRFQVWLQGGDEVAAALAVGPLAKSALPTQDRATVRRAREQSGYPRGARHEALSVALAGSDPRALAGSGDPDLVLHLIGIHHGRGRPFWPIVPDEEDLIVSFTVDGLILRAGTRHGLERLDSGWTDRFWGLVHRYGPWGLALLEAILMLADQRRSQDEEEGRA